jgi:hypothetical protein
VSLRPSSLISIYLVKIFTSAVKGWAGESQKWVLLVEQEIRDYPANYNYGVNLARWVIRCDHYQNTPHSRFQSNRNRGSLRRLEFLVQAVEE